MKVTPTFTYGLIHCFVLVQCNLHGWLGVKCQIRNYNCDLESLAIISPVMNPPPSLNPQPPTPSFFSSLLSLAIPRRTDFPSVKHPHSCLFKETQNFQLFLHNRESSQSFLIHPTVFFSFLFQSWLRPRVLCLLSFWCTRYNCSLRLLEIVLLTRYRAFKCRHY